MENQKNKRILVLDDSAERMEWFKRTFKDCDIDSTGDALIACEMIKKNKYSVIFLDHDLGDEWPSGREVTKMLMSEPLIEKMLIVIHTNNPSAIKQMKEDVKKYGCNVWDIPFCFLIGSKREEFVF